MKKLFLTLFPKPTFQSLTSGLRKTIAKLEKLTETNWKAAIGLNQIIADHHVSISALDSEAARAQSTAMKLRDLIGEP